MDNISTAKSQDTHKFEELSSILAALADLLFSIEYPTKLKVSPAKQ